MATYLIDRGFQRYEFGYGSAVAVILFIDLLRVRARSTSASRCAATPRAP